MLPSMVAPMVGPFTTPSRIVSWPFCRVNSARKREKAMPFGRAGRSARGHAIERRFALDGEIADVDQAFLGPRFDRRRIHRQRELAADHLGVGVGEAEERAGVVGLEIDHVAALRMRRANLAVSGVSRPSLPLSAKLLIVPLRRDILTSTLRTASPL